jgi:tetratricopeptide (TPR) repeat protein
MKLRFFVLQRHYLLNVDDSSGSSTAADASTLKLETASIRARSLLRLQRSSHTQTHLLATPFIQHQETLYTSTTPFTLLLQYMITMCNQFIVASSKIRPLALPAETSTTKPPEERDSPQSVVLRQVMADMKRHRLAGASHKVAETYNSLGLIRLHMECNPEAAKECHEQALRIFRQLGEGKLVAITLHDLGYCLERMGERELALQQYREAIECLQEEHLTKTHPRMIATTRAMNRVLRS